MMGDKLRFNSELSLRSIRKSQISQKQNVVEVRLKNGSTRKGIATGNNAAWICVCGRVDPLLGISGLLNGVSEGFRVDCSECNRKYFVVPDGKSQGPVLEVIEAG